jgi:predicted alpha/beta superfamily hydrolase
MTNACRQLATAAAIALALPVLAVQVQPARAEQTTPAAPTPSSVPGYTMPSTQMWDMTSDGGDIYRIFVSFPGEGEPPAGGYPVLYVLDGNAMFAGFAETRRIMEYDDGGKAIVVGVGYPTDKAYDVRRLKDFTSSGPPPQPWRDEFAKLPSGGRDMFLDFLTGMLRSEIGKRYKINLDRQALFGHSLGGLLAVHALFKRPDAFHAVIAASPTLFWHEREMLLEERDFASRLQAGEITKVSRLMVVAGELEETAVERWDAEAFVKRMEPLSAYGLRTRSEIYAGEGHVTVPSRAVTDTLRFAFSWP